MVKAHLKNSKLIVKNKKVIVTGEIDGIIEKQGKKSNKVELNFSVQDHVVISYI